MNQDESIRPDDFLQDEAEEYESTSEAEQPDELDVQRTVVEALAAEKAELADQFASLKSKSTELEQENNSLKEQINVLRAEKEEVRSALERMSGLLIKNTDRLESSQIALLDRDVNIDDRFPGETRDHVLEIIREARDTYQIRRNTCE